MRSSNISPINKSSFSDDAIKITKIYEEESPKKVNYYKLEKPELKEDDDSITFSSLWSAESDHQQEGNYSVKKKKVLLK